MITKFKLLYSEEFDRWAENDLEILNDKFKGWVMISYIKTHYLYVTNWSFKRGGVYLEYTNNYCIETSKLFTNRIKVEIRLNNNMTILKYEESEPNVRYSEFDPYGEEDWGE